MGKRRRILVAGLVLAALGGVAWALFFTAEPEPVYQGKRLSAWLELYHTQYGMPDQDKVRHADDAVRHIGTNAIPTLLRMLRLRDSASTLKLMALVQKQHFVKIHFVPASQRNEWAARGFYVLGNTAREALPALLAIYEENLAPYSRMCALQAVGGIGPGAKAAVPFLLKVASDTNTPDLLVRRDAISALGQIHAEPELVVPALAKALNDPRIILRVYAVMALEAFGPDAKPAVPALLKLFENQNPDQRLAIAQAVRKIDPEAAALRKAEFDAAIQAFSPQF